MGYVIKYLHDLWFLPGCFLLGDLVRSVFFSRKHLQTFLNIQSPRYLGPAYTDGAVYIASQQNYCTDIVVFKGNLNSDAITSGTRCVKIGEKLKAVEMISHNVSLRLRKRKFLNWQSLPPIIVVTIVIDIINCQITFNI